MTKLTKEETFAKRQHDSTNLKHEVFKDAHEKHQGKKEKIQKEKPKEKFEDIAPLPYD